MRRATWNKTIPGVLLIGLFLLGLANGAGIFALAALIFGIVLLALGLTDKSTEKV